MRNQTQCKLSEVLVGATFVAPPLSHYLSLSLSVSPFLHLFPIPSLSFPLSLSFLPVSLFPFPSSLFSFPLSLGPSLFLFFSFSFSISISTSRLVDQWFLGTVMRLRWREKGWGDRRTAPYIVRLDDGRTVFAPLDSDGCVRAISGQADTVARVSVQDRQRSSSRTRQQIARRSQSGRSVTPRRAFWEWEGC